MKQVGGNHYESLEIEPFSVIDDWGRRWPKDLHFYLGNAVKYVARIGNKPNGNPKEDLLKAAHYLQEAADRIEESFEHIVSFEHQGNCGTVEHPTGFQPGVATEGVPEGWVDTRGRPVTRAANGMLVDGDGQPVWHTHPTGFQTTMPDEIWSKYKHWPRDLHAASGYHDGACNPGQRWIAPDSIHICPMPQVTLGEN